MRKLNKFELGIIQDALNLWHDKFVEEIRETEKSSGGRCFYHESFPGHIKEDIFLKLYGLTKKS